MPSTRLRDPAKPTKEQIQSPRSDEIDAVIASFERLAKRRACSTAGRDKPVVQSLLLVESTATDDRHFVKKAVNMALRAIGKRNCSLNAAAIAVAERLSTAPQAAARWVGKDSLKELTGSALIKRLAARK